MRSRSLAAVLVVLLPMSGRSAPGPDRVVPNDGRRTAGTLRDGILTLHLEARPAMWHPDGDDAPGAEVPAFAERGRAPEIPGPLIRVPAGTEVVITVRNAVPRETLVIHGFHARPLRGGAAQPVRVAPGGAREMRFRLDAPGTYYYWGTTTGRVFQHRTREDAQLSGAIVVDPAGAPPPADRILVIGIWTDTIGAALVPSSRMLFVVNGRSWPHTERLTYGVGDTARWRVLNISADVHPMHLHGFYFRIDSRGDGRGDTTYADADRDLVATQFLAVGQTIHMTWVPERLGNWLFHCHIPAHFAPRGPLGLGRPETHEAARGHLEANHALEGMNGLVVGVTVTPRAGAAGAPDAGDAGRRRLRLLVRENAGGTSDSPFYAFALHEGGDEPPPDSGLRVGPPIVLMRGEPVSITVVNRTPEPTAVHWHGIELESYFDGVAGFSGAGTRVAPVIATADSFEARFTPPRAGTFIYHTHVDELRQQRAGLAGALVVLEPGARLDPATDVVVLITSPSDSTEAAAAVLLNGRLTPAALGFRAGVPHRVRIINITVGRPGLRMELRRDGVVSQWRVVAKDGADIPVARRRTAAAHQPVSIGETVDIEIAPAAAGEMRLEARTATGDLLGVIPIRVR
jgi:FtsP/CotA-like multicopper oxidase with cupredoxin domain